MKDVSKMPDALLPLTPAVLNILLALADGELHGYAIMREVEASSQGAVRMGPGTLYGAIKKLLAAKLIHEWEARPDDGCDDERRRYYALTAFGAEVLNAELKRMRTLLKSARNKKLVQAAGAAA